ncbi:TonB-dependent receptor [Marinilabiliaceae bacterium ANBcel2]|nr:TonB-dependent receptor [Marinilabiliaceae bacterium ANBcel2]
MKKKCECLFLNNRKKEKLWLVMKFSFIFFMTCFLQVSASTYSQHEKVTLSVVDLELLEVLDALEEQTSVSFFYNYEQVAAANNVTLNVIDEDLMNVLDAVFQNQNLEHSKVSEELVVIKEKESSNLMQQQTVERLVEGSVTDDEGEPVPGASVTIEGTTTGTVTNSDGEYSLRAPVNSTLIFTFIGFESEEVVVADQDEINVVLSAGDIELDDVVVVGYGTQQRVSVVGSVQTAEPRLLDVPSSNLSTSFAGRLAGVIATQRSGEPGADGADFYIRGISTFSGATNPLIILDGVQVSQADLDALSPEVIESFSILKDATATALYGTRGANGVMIVTTRSGADLERASVNVRVENSISGPTSVPDFVDGVQFMNMYNEAVIGRGTGEIPYSQTKIDGTRQGHNPYLFPNVDWYNELFKDYAHNQNVNVNVRGGGQRMDYFMNVAVNLDNGILESHDLNSYDNNVSVQRYSFQNNINAHLSETTRLSLRLNARIRENQGPAIGAPQVFGLVMEANPVDFPIMFPNHMLPDGTDHIAYGGKSGGRFNDGYRNPFAEMVKGYTEGFQSTVIATIDGEQKLDFITEGLTFKSMASFKNWSSTTVNRSGGVNQYEATDIRGNNEDGYEYDLKQVGNVQDPTLGTSTGTSGDRTIYFQSQIEYDRRFDDHRISTMGLYTQEEYMVNNPDGLIQSLPRRRQGLAGRFTYDYDNRYMAEFNFGYNGSENFAKGERFGFFPSVAAGYVPSNEDYWLPLSHAVSFLKLRGSWGKVGNDQIGGQRFVYMSDINLTGAGYTTGIDMNYSRSGPVYNRYENTDISWEIGTKVNLGFDMELFNTLNVVFDVYKENREGIFLERGVIPTSFGTANTSVYGNLGEVENKGFDLAVDMHHNFSDDFSMELKGTFTYSRNKVLDMDEPLYTQYPNLSRVGQPIHRLWGYQAERLFIDEAEIENSPLQQLGGTVMPGDIKYSDITGTGMVNSDDRIPMGHPTIPEIVYGFGPSFRYKNFDWSIYFQGVDRSSFFINNFHPFGTSEIRNVLQFIADDYWSVENQNVYAEYPRLSKLNHPNNTANSSYWLRDASFLKLKNAEIGYTHDFMRIYVSGMNLLTFSDFDLWDPEQGGGNGLGYPTQRVFNIGIQMTL